MSGHKCAKRLSCRRIQTKQHSRAGAANQQGSRRQKREGKLPKLLKLLETISLSLSLSLYIYIYIYIHIYTYIYMYIYIYIYINMYIHIILYYYMILHVYTSLSLSLSLYLSKPLWKSRFWSAGWGTCRSLCKKNTSRYDQFSNKESLNLEFESSKFLNERGGLS